jgi:CTD small phosphatase-like protein 2
MYIKDLRIINRSLSEMVLIDNAAYSYSFQLENGIPILPYYEGSNDFELKSLEAYLTKLAACKDVRELNKKTFKLHHYGKFNNPEELVEELYSL